MQSFVFNLLDNACVFMTSLPEIYLVLSCLDVDDDDNDDDDYEVQ